jgi:hypothetical protein
MFTVDILFNGKKVRPNEIANELERAMLRDIQSDVARKLRGLRDPETGRPPKVTLVGRSLRDLSFKISGSEAVIAEVKRRLR